MSLNWKEIDLILKELDLEGALIQQINQPVHNILVFDLHKPKNSFTLFISLSPTGCRLHRLTKRKYKNLPRPQRFAGFLRARIRGTRIVEAAQIQEDRVIRLVTKKGDELLYTWIRLWSNAANVIVTDTEGNIQDACYRRKKREEMSGGHFNPLESTPRVQKKEFKIRDFEGEGDFNSYIEALYYDRERTKEMEELTKKALHNLDSRESYLKTQINTLQKNLDQNRSHERFKEIGDILMASLSSIKKGDKWFKTVDFYHDNAEIDIELNPELDPSANAQAYYKKQSKIKRSLGLQEEKLENLENQLEGVNASRQIVLEGKNYDTIRSLAQIKEKGTGKTVKELPGITFFSGDYKILVGRTAKENDQLLRRHVRGNDYWFHARDYPGGYVFVKIKPGKSVPLEVMLDAGNLAVFYSKGKNSGKGDIYYTQVKYLRRAKDSKQGLVLPTQEKNLHIALETERIEKLKKSKEFY